MTNKGADMSKEREIKMFGMTAAEVREQFGNSLTARFCGVEMVVMSIMSDVQELLAMDADRPMVNEEVRKMMNIGKLLLSDLQVKNQERLHKEAA